MKENRPFSSWPLMVAASPRLAPVGRSLNERARRRIATAHLAALLAIGCGDTGQETIEHEAYGQGTPPEPIVVGEWDVILEQGRVSFGPAYFCANAAASADLCPTAVVELRSVAVVDALDDAPQRIGEIRGVTGDVRSAIFDYGISWFSTQAAATPSRGSVDGLSAMLEGTATAAAGSLRFRIEVRASPIARGTFAVVGAAARHSVTGDERALIVRFDPTPWLSAVDFDSLAASGEDPVLADAGTSAHDAVVFSMTSSHLPAFEWRTELP